MPMTLVDYPDHITRVDIITAKDRREYWADEWTTLVQDGGRTLVLYAHGSGEDARVARAEAFAEDISEAR